MLFRRWILYFNVFKVTYETSALTYEIQISKGKSKFYLVTDNMQVFISDKELKNYLELLIKSKEKIIELQDKYNDWWVEIGPQEDIEEEKKNIEMFLMFWQNF